jgi:hypothetical protein
LRVNHHLACVSEWSHCVFNLSRINDEEHFNLPPSPNQMPVGDTNSSLFASLSTQKPLYVAIEKARLHIALSVLRTSRSEMSTGKVHLIQT